MYLHTYLTYTHTFIHRPMYYPYLGATMAYVKKPCFGELILRVVQKIILNFNFGHRILDIDIVKVKVKFA